MRYLIGSLALLGLLSWAMPAYAADDTGAAAKEEKKEGAKEGEEDKVDMSEEVIFERLTGLYFEGRGGGFFTLGGTRGFSNAQPFFGFEIGYDITEAFSMQFSYASGYQAANPVKKDPIEKCVPLPEGAAKDKCYENHMDFGMTFLNISADYDVWSGRRFALEVRLGGGVVLIDPTAIEDQGPVDGDVFGGLRFEYYTMLRHFTIGAELNGYYVIPTGIPAMSVSVSVLYNF